jgi:Zyg-11 family protein
LIVIGLKTLRNLRSLDISHTKFNKFGLEIVVSDLPCLEHLNISATDVHDLNPLRRCRHRLKSLSAYDLDCTFSDQVLLELVNLQYLDISTEKESAIYATNHLFTLLQNLASYPALRHLDISGQCVVMFDHPLKYFETGAHQLQFLGLMETNLCFFPMFEEEEFKKRCIVTGSADIDQLLNALRVYSHRRTFTLRALCLFYDHTNNFQRSSFEPITLVLKAMECHQSDFDVQMAGTACLCNLIKACNEGDVHPVLLGRVVNAVLGAIERFPDKTQILRNSLLTLCNEIILKDAIFDRFRCTKLMMNAMIRHTDTQIRRMAVAISSVLAARISTKEIAYFGSNAEYISTLLNIINNCLFPHESASDNLLKCTLSALWNLTDESPVTCRVFLEKGGLDLYNRVLEVFTDNIEFQNKVLGLINNIAEVPYLRSKIMNGKFIKTLTFLAFSRSIHVSYFAVGILCHLAGSFMEPFWNSCESTSYEEVLESIAVNVLKWRQPCNEMVAYRSFYPFGWLLNCDIPEVQLWAIWAINHVCTANPKSYCLKLIEGKFLAPIQKCHQKYPSSWDVNACSPNCAIRKKVEAKRAALKDDSSCTVEAEQTDSGSVAVDVTTADETGCDETDEDKHVLCRLAHEDRENSLTACSTQSTADSLFNPFSHLNKTSGEEPAGTDEYQQCTQDHLKQKLFFNLHRLSHETLELVHIHYSYALKS